MGIVSLQLLDHKKKYQKMEILTRIQCEISQGITKVITI